MTRTFEQSVVECKALLDDPDMAEYRDEIRARIVALEGFIRGEGVPAKEFVAALRGATP